MGEANPFQWGHCSSPPRVPSKTGVYSPQSSGSPEIKSCWPSAPDSLGIPSLCQISRPGSLTWCSELSQQTRTSLVLLFFSLWVTHLVGVRFDFIVIVPHLSSCGHFFFVSGCGVSFFGGFQCLPVVGCSTAGHNFGVLTGGDNHMSFYSAILNRKPRVVFKLYFTE